MSMPPGGRLIICRTCLRQVPESNNTYFYIDTFDNLDKINTVPKDLLQLCVPEMDLYISNAPGICDECLSMFERFAGFKNNCLAIEDKIQSYIERYQISQVTNLTSVINDHDDDSCFSPPFFMLQDRSTDNGNNNSSDFTIDNILLKNPNNDYYHRHATKPIDDHFLRLNSNSEDNVVHQLPLLSRESLMLINNNDNIAPTTGNTTSLINQIIVLTCNNCSYVTVDEAKLAAHKCMLQPPPSSPPPPSAKYTGKKTYKCPYCEYCGSRRQRLANHINSKHTRLRWYDCNLCAFKSTNGSSLQRHMTVVHGVKIEQHSVDQQPSILLNCVMCQFKAMSQVALDRHVNVKHGGGASSLVQSCHFCDYQSKDRSNFRKHMYQHTGMPRKCLLCEYKCVSPFQLARHFRRNH